MRIFDPFAVGNPTPSIKPTTAVTLVLSNHALPPKKMLIRLSFDNFTIFKSWWSIHPFLVILDTNYAICLLLTCINFKE